MQNDGLRRIRRGVSSLEMTIAVVLAILCLTAIFRLFSNYSRSFLKVDNRIENIAEGWLTMRALADDLQMADVPEGDPRRWAESIKATGQGAVIWKRSGGALVEVSYTFQPQAGSLVRSVGGTRMALIPRRCRGFTFEPAFGAVVGSWPQRVSVHVRLVLENASAGAVVTPPPMELETTFVPECLNLRLQQSYVHQGVPSSL